MNWDLMDVIAATKATPNRLPEGSLTLTGISTDSRSLKRGELFVALKGERYDGHRFVPAALERGAGAILAQDPTPCHKAPLLIVPDTLQAYGMLGWAYRESLKTRIMAITGSMGKTTTKEMAAAILARKYRVTRTESNENNRVGVPKTLLKIPQDTDVAVVELGSSIPGEISLLTDIARPDDALVTNIAPAHLERFRTTEGIRLEKSALFWCSPPETLRYINRDDENIRKIPLMPDWPTLTFGTAEDASVRVHHLESLGLKGTRFTLSARGDTVRVSLPLLGEHQVRNAVAAAALGVAGDIPLNDIKEALESFQPPKGRLEPMAASPDCVVLDDTYNANPVATVMAIRTLAGFKNTHTTIALLGDMLELGEGAAAFHEEVGAACARHGIDLLGLTGTYREAVRKGAMENGFNEDRIFFFDDESALLRALTPYFRRPSIILVKGSHALNMAKWVNTILTHARAKGRER